MKSNNLFNIISFFLEEISDDYKKVQLSILKSFLKKNKSFLKERLNSWFENKWRIYLDIKDLPDFKVVISHHPTDILKFFRIFNIDNFFNKYFQIDFGIGIPSLKEKILEEILFFFVAFLIKKDDTKINNPINGLLLAPYLDNKLNLYYFIIPVKNKTNYLYFFRKIVASWLFSKQGKIPSPKEYLLNPFIKLTKDDKNIDLKQRILYFKDKDKESITFPLPNWLLGEKKVNKPLKFKYDSNGNFIWLKGSFEDGVWINGIWEANDSNSIFYHSQWKDGIFRAKNGVFKDSIWFKGIFEDGIFLESVFKGGTFKNGIFKNSIFEWGTFQNGLFVNSKFRNGTFENGIFKNSSFHNGEWIDGYWKSERSFNPDAKWKIGWIFDPKREGNFEKNWIWKGDYVRSPINPVEYFR